MATRIFIKGNLYHPKDDKRYIVMCLATTCNETSNECFQCVLISSKDKEGIGDIGQRSCDNFVPLREPIGITNKVDSLWND